MMVRLWWSVVVLVAVVSNVLTDGATSEQEKEVAQLKMSLAKLYKQMMRNQLHQEEVLRSTGGSGIKQVRVVKSGDRPYHTYDHGGRAFMAMHNHANYKYTVGLGEFIAVLNGVEFRTRHNDYKLLMASRTSGEDRATEPIPLPDVPPAVLEKESVEEQIDEMRLWFKAFQDTNRSKRDYRKYFKPIVCYLEGAWTHSGEAAEDPFASERHSLADKTWDEIIQDVEYAAYSGSKDIKENMAYLPTKIWEMNGTDPVVVQWNYRILCEPLDYDIPLRYLRPVDDLASRMRFQRGSWEEHVNSRACRFEYNYWTAAYPSDHFCNYCMDEQMMDNVPGRDNYLGDLRDDSFGATALHYKTAEPLNIAYYNRRYQSDKKGAMGGKTRSRGFSDGTVFMAQTTQPKIAAMTSVICDEDGDNCRNYTTRWTYAIPLEIVWMTPLLSWNPYNITNKGDVKNEWYRTVTKGGRNGGMSQEKAYDGINMNHYYLTPAELFGSTEDGESDPADTSAKSVGVLDSQGTLREVVASGHRVLLDPMPGVGVVRTRYPIAPLHNDGNQILKEVEALKDVVTKMNEYQHMLREIPNFDIDDGTQDSP